MRLFEESRLCSEAYKLRGFERVLEHLHGLLRLPIRLLACYIPPAGTKVLLDGTSLSQSSVDISPTYHDIVHPGNITWNDSYMPVRGTTPRIIRSTNSWQAVSSWLSVGSVDLINLISMGRTLPLEKP